MIDMKMMMQEDILTVDSGALMDIRKVRPNDTLRGQERLNDFVLRIGNPYCFRYGDMIVKLRFAEEGPSFMDRLESCLQETGTQKCTQREEL